MLKLSYQQKLIEKVYNKDEKATNELRPAFMRLLKKYLMDQGGYTARRFEEIASSTLFVLYRKPEPPQLDNVLAKTYLLGIAKTLFKKAVRKVNTESVDNIYLDSIPSVDNVIEEMEIAEHKKILNNVISQMSVKCRELLEKYYLDLNPDEICLEMNYASKSVYYKKKSLCIDRLKELVRKSPKCQEYFND